METPSDIFLWAHPTQVSSIVLFSTANFSHYCLAAHVHHPINLSHNPHLVSFHYKMAREGLGQAAVDMFSSLSFNSITTVGIDTREELLRDPTEIQQLQRLDAILASPAFSKLSRVLVRLEPEPYTDEYPLLESSDIIFRTFRLGHARKMVEVEKLKDERREGIRDLADDCSEPGYQPEWRIYQNNLFWRYNH
jgi:hypothetical protein